jgi:L-ascorbate metabolism protein UlaG (beta-lactamase superfamily)
MAKNLGVSLTWLGHGTVFYHSASGRSVLVDAWVDHNPACPEKSKDLKGVDLLLITHAHGDHFQDCLPIAKRYNPDIVCNFETAEYLEAKGVQKLHGMNKGGTAKIGDIRVSMVNAVHSNTIQDGDKTIAAGEPCGYVIQFENGASVYHAGDTAVHSDMKLIGEIYKPAVAVLPIGDFYTMGPREASAAARLVGAPTVFPIHHSTFPVLTGKPAELIQLLSDREDIEVVDWKPGETVS